LSVVLFGTLPALRATRSNLASSLKSGGRGSVGSDRSALHRGIVVGQMALSLLLVSAAALLVTTLRNLARVDGGFATENVLVVAIETRGTPYERSGVVPLHREILQRVASIPGIDRVGMSTYVPLFGGRRATRRLVLPTTEGRSRSGNEDVVLQAVTPGYLAAAGIALRSGRDISTADDAGGDRVAIVGET